MSHKKPLTIASRIRSFGYAFKGIATLVQQEPNAKLHFLATVVVIVAGIWQDISSMEWIALAIAIGLVWIAEAFNTALEMFCDLATEGKWHPVVKKIKDISAAAVLIAAAVSVSVALFVFLL